MGATDRPGVPSATPSEVCGTQTADGNGLTVAKISQQKEKIAFLPSFVSSKGKHVSPIYRILLHLLIMVKHNSAESAVDDWWSHSTLSHTYVPMAEWRGLPAPGKYAMNSMRPNNNNGTLQVKKASYQALFSWRSPSCLQVASPSQS